MRIATSEGLLTWTYSLRDSPDGPTLAKVEMKGRRTAGTITVAEVAYGFKQTDLWGKTIVLTFEGIELAKAVRTSAWTSKTKVVFADGGLPGPNLRLTPLGAFQVGFRVDEVDGDPVGRIERRGVLKTAFQLHLPASMPLALQGFLTALAMVDLRRRQSS